MTAIAAGHTCGMTRRRRGLGPDRDRPSRLVLALRDERRRPSHGYERLASVRRYCRPSGPIAQSDAREAIRPVTAGTQRAAATRHWPARMASACAARRVLERGIERNGLHRTGPGPDATGVHVGCVQLSRPPGSVSRRWASTMAPRQFRPAYCALFQHGRQRCSRACARGGRTSKSTPRHIRMESPELAGWNPYQYSCVQTPRHRGPSRIPLRLAAHPSLAARARHLAPGISCRPALYCLCTIEYGYGTNASRESFNVVTTVTEDQTRAVTQTEHERIKNASLAKVGGVGMGGLSRSATPQSAVHSRLSPRRAGLRAARP